jgi:hypothetical protein
MTDEKHPPQSLDGDLMTGAAEIATFLGIPQKRAFALASSGKLPGVFRWGHHWQARKSTLLREIARLESAAGGKAA